MAIERKTDMALPPQNLEAEESVLGSMMISPGAITAVAEQLQEHDFYRDSHRLIFRAIVDLFNSGEPVDPITVTEQLTAAGAIERVGGRAYIHTLVSTVPAASNASYYAGIVKENSLLRSIIQVGNEIARLGYERPGDVREMLDQCEKMMFDVSQHQIHGEFRAVKELLDAQFERIEKLHNSGKKITGIRTHFPDLDKLTSGLQPSNLVILAARPSMGKTSLALDFAQNIAIKDNIPVALFSLEMSESELVQRMMCKQGRVDSHRLRNGTVGADDWAKLTDAGAVLSKAPIYVDDTASVNMLEIRAKTRRLVSRHPDLGLVIIDYLQLMDNPGNRTQNREQEIAKISRSMKIMARELNLPVLALSQLSRASEKRDPPRPILSDLRESGAIEQDADMVLFVYRPRNDDTGHLENTAELIIAKHRNGPTGKVDLVFNDKFASFGSASR
ncbi:MAG: replicative DNA helicase [Thermoleophilia bacterium]